MPDERLVSVAIACYNQARYVGEAIQSVLDQTYRNLEVIVVDDGSSDDSSKIASSFPGVRTIRQSNLGVAAARNSGFKESSGEFLIFLDGDDRLEPQAVESGLRCMHQHSDCAFVFGNCRLISEDGRELPTRSELVVPDDYYLALLQSNLIWMPAVAMFRREALGQSEPFAMFADHCCDYELYLRLARQFPVGYHDDIVAQWRQHSDNISHNSARMFLAVRRVLKSQRPHVKGRPVYETALKTGLQNYNDSYGDRVARSLGVHLRAHEFQPFLKDFFVLLSSDPQGTAKHAFRKISVTMRRRFLKGLSDQVR
jgi:glycosyltransferase involved in cell wall biosynthesis